MSITIGHRFPSWLTLYGDNGNVKALSFYLNKKLYEADGIKSGSDFEVKVENIEDLKGVDLEKFDILYMGSGRECGLDYAAKQFADNKDAFMKFIESGKTVLITGNAVKAGVELGLYELYTEKNDFFVSDVTATSELFEGEVRGFQNTRYLIKENETPVFILGSGHGNSDSKPAADADGTGNGCSEGFAYKNLIATSVIGPLIAINENFKNMIIERLNCK